MILVYIAGPYTADTPEGIRDNIAAAAEVAASINRRGKGKLFAVSPHSMTERLAAIHDPGYEFWIEGDLALLGRCDALVVMRGYLDSRGTAGEIAEARRTYKPIFFVSICGTIPKTAAAILAVLT